MRAATYAVRMGELGQRCLVVTRPTLPLAERRHGQRWHLTAPGHRGEQGLARGEGMQITAVLS